MSILVDNIPEIPSRFVREQRPRLFTASALGFARNWIQCWNSHDLARIGAHYSCDVAFSSPFIQKLGICDRGVIEGRAELMEYFAVALRKFPDLKFQLGQVLYGNDAITLVYNSVAGLVAAETMLLDPQGFIKQVWAQYDRV